MEGDLVFDLTSSSCGDGSVRVIHFNIADHDDDPSTEFPCGIRAIVEELPDDDDNGLTAILLDSGADASVFPLSLMEAGVPASGKGTRLCDAQGRQIPVEGNRLQWKFACQPAVAGRFC